MAIRKKTGSQQEVDIAEMETEEVSFCILGTTPLLMHAFNKKLREMLLPSPKKNAAQKASSLKHNPIQEFRDSVYILPDPNDPTLLCLKATAFKGALCGVATDIPGSTRAQVGRLVRVVGEYAPIWGIPHLSMWQTKPPTLNAAPDVSSKAALPEWASVIRILFQKPLITVKTVSKLLMAAGQIRGVGDYRTEKGMGNYGSFSIVDPTNEDFRRIVETSGRQEQFDALFADTPLFLNRETEEMYTWYLNEIDLRGMGELYRRSFTEEALPDMLPAGKARKARTS